MKNQFKWFTLSLLITFIFGTHVQASETTKANLENMTSNVQSSKQYTLVVKEDGSEYAFNGLTLTQEIPAEMHFYIKDSDGKIYYAKNGKHRIFAENHENLDTYYPVEDKTLKDKPVMFYLQKANTWTFSVTEPKDADGTIKLTVNPKDKGETKYMITKNSPMQESNDTFNENLQMTREFAAGEAFYITRSDDYGLYELTPAESNVKEGHIAFYIWEFSEENPTVGYLPGERINTYRIKEAGKYTITLDVENQNVTVKETPITYTLVTKDGDVSTEYAFDGLTLTQEIPAEMHFYIKDSNGKIYYAENGKHRIFAENHENLDTYYPVEDKTPKEKPVMFYLQKANTWTFSVTEPKDADGTIKLTVNPKDKGETKYMITKNSPMQESNDTFNENLQMTREFAAGEAFYITRSDDYGLYELTPAESNVKEGHIAFYIWEFSEENPTVGYLPGERINTYRIKEAGKYTITLDVENQNVTVKETPITYTLVTKDGDVYTEHAFDGLSLTKEIPALVCFFIKDSNGKEYYAGNNSNKKIIAENHDDLETYYSVKAAGYFYISKTNTWVFNITEATDGSVRLSVNPKTKGETKYMISQSLKNESDDVFVNNTLTKEMTTRPFFIIRSDDYGIAEMTSEGRNDREGYCNWVFSNEDNTVNFIPGERRNMYKVKKEGTYTFTLDLEKYTVTAELGYKLIDGNDYPFMDLKSDISVPKATYQRSFSATQVGKNQAWYVPMDYTITPEDAENFTFYKMQMIAGAAEAGEADPNKMFMYIEPMNVGDKLVGNRPYTVKPKKALQDYVFTAENTTLYAPNSDSRLNVNTSTHSYEFYGQYVRESYVGNEGDMYFFSGGILHPNNSTTTLIPYRWNIHVSPYTSNDGYSKISSAIVEDDNATGINTIQDIHADGIEGIYTINGARIEEPVKGIYIVKYKNGKTEKRMLK